MKSLLSLVVLSLALTSCEKKSNTTEIPITPVTTAETRAILLNLKWGQPLDDLRPIEEDCKTFQATLPPHYVKGFVTVPEDYNNPRARQIKVFYYGRLEKGKDPIVFFNGGPASDSHGSAEVLENLPQTENLSFIYVDQRGTGCSDAFPQSPANIENVQRLTHYTTTEIAQDSEAIRIQLLGEKSKWKIFGQSYGGQIVHRYSILAPQSIKAAYAHGLSLMTDQTEWLKLRIQSQKRVSEIYFSNYPNDRQILLKIRSLIGDNLCFNDGTTKICGAKVMDAATILLGFSNNWEYLHKTLSKILSPNSQLDQSALENFVRTFVFGVYTANGLAASVISVVEMSDGTSDSDVCKKVNERLEAEGQYPLDWPINECRLLTGLANDQWNSLLSTIKINTSISLKQFKASLDAHPELPFFLYSGEKDVFVPIETFAEELATLGTRITYRQFPRSGHEGFYTEQKVWDDIFSVK